MEGKIKWIGTEKNVRESKIETNVEKERRMRVKK